MLASIKFAFRLFPVARSYWRKHGFVATIARSVEVLFERKRETSVAAAGEWVGRHDFGASNQPCHPDLLKRKKVAIIGALDLPQCLKYRVLQKIEQLHRSFDINVVISSYVDIPRAFDCLQLATSVIFYRVPFGQQFLAYLQEAERLGIQTFYDIDDPLFAKRVYEKNKNLETLSPSERHGLIAECSSYLEAMRRVDGCIVSTPGLVELTRSMIKAPVYLWRNALDCETLDISARILESREAPRLADERQRSGKITIGYMSGSRAHDSDFALIGEPIACILDAHPQVEFLIKGYAELPGSLERFASRIVREGFSGYHDYFRTMDSCDVIVVPLLADQFNACKSAIRYLEASALQKPCVMSRVGDVCNLAEDGESILFADSDAEWASKLEILVASHDSRTTLGKAARSNVYDRYSSSAVATNLDAELIAALRGEHVH